MKKDLPPWVVLLLLLMTLSGLGAIAVVTGAIRPFGSRRADSMSAARFFSGLKAEQDILGRLAKPRQDAPPPDSVAFSRGTPAPTVIVRQRAGPGAGAGAADEDALREKLGRWDAEKARELGERGPMLQALERIAAYPRLVRLLLDNQLVVDIFAKGALEKPHCRSGRALTRFLTDTGDPRGISAYLDGVGVALDHPGSLDAVLESRTATEIMTRCPSFVEFTHDGGMIAEVMMKNERFRRYALDPRVIEALTHQAASAQLYRNAQAVDSALAGFSGSFP